MLKRFSVMYSLKGYSSDFVVYFYNVRVLTLWKRSQTVVKIEAAAAEIS